MGKFFFLKNIFLFKPDEIRYIKLKHIAWYKIRHSTITIFLSFVCGAMFYLGLTALYHTPEELHLRSLNTIMELKYAEMIKALNKLSMELSEVENRDDMLYRSLLDQAILDSIMRLAGKGGKASCLPDRDYPEIVSETRQRMEALAARMKVEEKSLNTLLNVAGRNRQRMLHLPAVMPVSNEDLTRTGSGFGMRYHPILNIYRMHEGLDFIVPKGTPIFSTADGRVADCRNSGTFGTVIEIDHGFGYRTLYAHLSKILVKPGTKVKRGEQIALSGNSGLSSGPHLHYEVHLNNKAQDPVNYFFNDLSPAEYEEIARLANRTTTSLD